MKFLYLFILASSATLAASAGNWDMYYKKSPFTPGPTDSPRVVLQSDTPKSIYSRQPFKEETDPLKLGSVSFQEAQKTLEDQLDANASDNTLVHIAFKYKTYSDWLAQLAKVKDDRGFLVVLDLLDTYNIKLSEKLKELKEDDHGLLDEVGLYVQDAFLTAAAQPDFFMMDILVRWGNVNFGKLVKKAMAEGHNSVDSLLKDERTLLGIASLWKNFEPDTTLLDLVGPHLLEHVMKKIEPSAVDQATANFMLIDMFGEVMLPSSLLRFMARLVKADGAAHEEALQRAFRLEAGNVTQFVVAALLASGKLEIREGFDYGFDEKENSPLRALCERDIRIRRVWAKKYRALAKQEKELAEDLGPQHMAKAKQYEAQAEYYECEYVKPKDRKHNEAYETIMLSMNLQPSTFNLGGTSNLPASNSAQSIDESEAPRKTYKNINFGGTRIRWLPAGNLNLDPESFKILDWDLITKLIDDETTRSDD